MSIRARLRLPHTLFLPLNPDGTLTEPTELRISVQGLREHDGQPKPYRWLTVHPHMRQPHLVTLYSEYVPSRKIPADVQAMVDRFNADIDRGWSALLADYGARIAEAASRREIAAEDEMNRGELLIHAVAGDEHPDSILAYAETFTVER